MIAFPVLVHPTPRRRARPIAMALALASTAVLSACTGSSGQSSSTMTSFSATESAASKAELFSLPADQASHIKLFTVTAAPLTRTLRLSGAVAYNSFLTTTVIAQVGGPVSRVVVTPGEHVTAGQPLLYVSSPDYTTMRAAYVKSRDAFQLADKVLTRARDLLAHGVIAQADVEQAESTRTQAQADLEASEQAIRILGIQDPNDVVGQPASTQIALRSPVAAEVVERLCSPGQLLQAGSTQCFTLSDTSSVWVLVNIFQNDIAHVHVGDPVTIESETYPDDVLRGTIQYIAPALDPQTRTLQARIQAANPGQRLKKDMYVTAQVRAGVVPDALLVPQTALLRDTENMPYVYVQTGQRQFARRSVTLGDSQGTDTQVLTGLQPGDVIVGDGSLFLQFQNSLQH